MKKYIKLLSLMLALLLMLSLCACGSNKAAKENLMSAADGAPAAYPAENEYRAEQGQNGFSAMEPSPGAADSDEIPEDAGSAESELDAKKIIYSADATVETTEFEKSIEELKELVAQYGGFIQSSSMRGNRYASISRGYDSGRSADYTLRIPSKNFNTLMEGLPTLGNVPYSNIYSENISSQYYDTQARLEACRTQEKTLNEMMEKAEKIEDVLAIEDKLSELRYRIESLESNIRNWDREVSYSTVNLSVQEVSVYTAPENVSLGKKLGLALRTGLADAGEFFEELLLFIVRALPFIVIIVILFFALRPAVRKGMAARAERRAAKAAARREKEPPEKK